MTFEQLVAGLIEVDRLAFAAEHGGGGAEVAAQGATHRGNERGRHVAGAIAGRHSHVARAEARNHLRVANGAVRLFPQVATEPRHAVPLDDEIGVDALAQLRHVGDVTADDDRGVGLVLADQGAHLLDLDQIGQDGRDADDVVLVGAKLLDEALEPGKVQHRASRLDVGLDEHDPPTAMEHPQRKCPLRPSDLVVVQLHRVHLPAAVLVVLAVGTEDAGQKHFGPRAQRVDGRGLGGWRDGMDLGVQF